jgi:hypothetical protein
LFVVFRQILRAGFSDVATPSALNCGTKFGAISEQPTERLRDAIADLVRAQLTLFLTIWLAVVFPVSCRHHFHMGWLISASHAHPIGEHQGHHALKQYPENEPGCPFLDHKTPLNDTIVLSLVVALVPDSVAVFLPYDKGSSMFECPVLSLQWAFMPAEPPPRSV